MTSAQKSDAPKRVSLVAKMAARYEVDPDKLMATLKATVFRGQKQKDGSIREATVEELMMLLVVADQYRLNPFTREIYAFPDDKRGGIVPVVSIDGWLRIINEHPQFAGMEIRYGDFDRPKDEADPYVEVAIARQDRAQPIVVREYMAECWRDTGPWQSHPRRMLRHKAIIQAGRVAFGFAGIYDPDEAERIKDAIDVTPTSVTTKPATQPPREKPAPAALPLLPRDELLADLNAALNAEGIEPVAVCHKFQAESIEALADVQLRDAAQWVRSVNAP